jgi:hypothetical protein
MISYFQLNIIFKGSTSYLKTKRETGEIPVRSRRCDGEVSQLTTGAIWEGVKLKEPKSEDLPLNKHQNSTSDRGVGVYFIEKNPQPLSLIWLRGLSLYKIKMRIV